MRKQHSLGVYLALMTLLLITGFTAAGKEATKPLKIYVIDVEGGNATLFVAPSEIGRAHV